MSPITTIALALIVGTASFFAFRPPPPEPPPEPPTLASVTSTTGSESIIALTKFLPHATSEELATLYTTLSLEEPHTAAAHAAILTQWTAIDPAAALAAVSEDHLPLLLQSWASHDLPGAIAAARDKGADTLANLLKSIGSNTPSIAEYLSPEERAAHELPSREETLQELNSRFAAIENPDEYYKFTRDFAKKVPRETLALLEDISDPRAREEFISDFISALDFSDPASLSYAEAALTLLPAGRTRSVKTADITGKLIGKDANAARSWANSLPPGDARDAAFGEIAYHEAKDDPASLFAYLDSIGWRTDLNLSTQAERTFSTGSKSGSGGGSWGSGSLKYALKDAMTTMIDQGEIATALAHVADVHDSRAAGSTIDDVFEHLALTDPETAFDFFANAPSHPLGNSLVSGALSELVTADPGLVIDRFPSLENTDFRSKLGDQIARHLAASDPVAAAEWWTTLGEPDQETLGSRIVAASASKNPAAAAAIVSEYPALFDSASYGRITRSWIDMDPQGVSEWITTLSPGKNRDTATGALVNALVSTQHLDLPAAVQWAETISDPARRTSALDTISNSLTK